MNKPALKNKKQNKQPSKNVEDYISALPEDIQEMLNKIRQAVKSAAPKAEEVISYQIPTYKLYGPLVHFMAKKDYCSFVTVNKNVLGKFKKELKDFDISGTTIHFTTENPIPLTLIKKIVKERVKENSERIK